MNGPRKLKNFQSVQNNEQKNEHKNGEKRVEVKWLKKQYPYILRFAEGTQSIMKDTYFLYEKDGLKFTTDGQKLDLSEPKQPMKTNYGHLFRIFNRYPYFVRSSKSTPEYTSHLCRRRGVLLASTARAHLFNFSSTHEILSS